MKKAIMIVVVMLTATVVFAQWKPERPLPYNVLAPQDSSSSTDAYAYSAHEYFSYHLKSAGKNIITSVVFDVVGSASVVIGTQAKNQETAKILYIAGAGCAVIGFVFLLNAGLELIEASEAHWSIHPTPNGVLIDL